MKRGMGRQRWSLGCVQTWEGPRQKNKSSDYRIAFLKLSLVTTHQLFSLLMLNDLMSICLHEDCLKECELMYDVCPSRRYMI